MYQKIKYVSIVIVVGILLLYAIIFFPGLQVKNIQYSGLNFVSKESFEKSISGLKGKSSFSLLFLSKFKASLLLQYPAIETLSFSYQFPDTVHINSHEKTAKYILVSRGEQFILSENGAILNKEVENASIKNMDELIIVKGLDASLFHGSYIPQWALKKIKKIVENINLYIPAQKLQIHLNAPYDIRIVKDDSLEIKLGTMAYLDIKFTHLKHFLEFYREKLSSIEYIDLRVEDRIVILENKEL